MDPFHCEEPEPPRAPTVTPPRPVARPEPPRLPAPLPRPAPAPAPFTTCATDTERIQRLPKPEVDPHHPQLGTPPGRWFPASVRATAGNQVIPYTYGRCCFADMAAAIETAIRSEHRIYLAGWWIDNAVKLRDPAAVPSGGLALLEQFLKATRAQVRALVWKAPKAYEANANNSGIVAVVNGLQNGACIWDDKLPIDPTPGAHHQKLVIVSGEQGLVAFTGGMDLNNSRVNVGGFEPLHDVHVRVCGPAAEDLLKVFRQRWEDHPESAGLEVRKFGARSDLPYVDAFPATKTARDVLTSTAPWGATPPADRLAAVGRTYADLQKHGSPDSYRFAPTGETTAWDMVRHAIETARRWIYVEDQYLTSTLARDALAKKLAQPGFEFLLIVVCRVDIADFPFGATWHNDIRHALAKADPSMTRWRMVTLVDSTDAERRKWCGSYVHSKTWIFDDEYAIVGTANCTDRSFTFDTEDVVGVAEPDVFTAAGRYGFARGLRIALWRKHLGVPHDQVRDYRAGLKLWKQSPKSTMTYPYWTDVPQRPYVLERPDPDDPKKKIPITIRPDEVNTDLVRRLVDPKG